MTSSRIILGAVTVNSVLALAQSVPWRVVTITANAVLLVLYIAANSPPTQSSGALAVPVLVLWAYKFPAMTHFY
jgi:hypothetical protein